MAEADANFRQRIKAATHGSPEFKELMRAIGDARVHYKRGIPL